MLGGGPSGAGGVALDNRRRAGGVLEGLFCTVAVCGRSYVVIAGNRRALAANTHCNKALAPSGTSRWTGLVRLTWYGLIMVRFPVCPRPLLKSNSLQASSSPSIPPSPPSASPKRSLSPRLSQTILRACDRSAPSPWPSIERSAASAIGRSHLTLVLTLVHALVAAIALAAATQSPRA